MTSLLVDGVCYRSSGLNPRDVALSRYRVRFTVENFSEQKLKKIKSEAAQAFSYYISFVAGINLSTFQAIISCTEYIVLSFESIEVVEP